MYVSIATLCVAALGVLVTSKISFPEKIPDRSDWLSVGWLIFPTVSASSKTSPL